MKWRPSTTTVRRSLAAHSGIGLTLGALMYLICLTGTLVVFHHALERWEQPHIAESLTYTPGQIGTAAGNFMAELEQTPEAIYVVLPTAAMPRMHVSAGETERFVTADGALANEPHAPWTAMVQNLHIQLHLPTMPGILLVGIVGVMLCALIVSGLVAHPRILRDAFRLRTGGNTRLATVDLHNRLSVWGLPFHLIIALTGAFIGLASLYYAGIAAVAHDGDRETVIAQMYGADPVIETPAPQRPNIRAALSALSNEAPEAKPIYVAIQHPGTGRQFIEVAATLPGRLVYSEIYRFDTAGDYLGHQGLSDGPVGRQAAYSVYRLHFGDFAGWPVKLLYLLMGLALTVICASGVNIWLAKRSDRSAVNDLWVAVVWGSPAALALAAAGAMLELPPLATFAAGLVAATGLALWLKHETRTRRLLIGALAGLLAAVVALHLGRHGLVARNNPAAGGVNAAAAGLAIIFAAYLWWSRPDTAPRGSAATAQNS